MTVGVAAAQASPVSAPQKLLTRPRAARAGCAPVASRSAVGLSAAPQAERVGTEAFASWPSASHVQGSDLVLYVARRRSALLHDCAQGEIYSTRRASRPHAYK